MKTEPTAVMRQFAGGLWQMYTALVDEGFSQQEALTILGQVLAANMGRGGE